MSRIIALFSLFIISCNQEWSSFETEDFFNRCKEYKPLKFKIDSSDYHDFCSCIEKQSQKLSLPYKDFLKQKLSDSDLEKIVNPCIDE